MLAVDSCGFDGVAVGFGIAETWSGIEVGRAAAATTRVVPLGSVIVPPLDALMVCVTDSLAPIGVAIGVGVGLGPEPPDVGGKAVPPPPPPPQAERVAELISKANKK